jgi:hypothetical protein
LNPGRPGEQLSCGFFIKAEARKSYRRALKLTRQASERRFLEQRLAEFEKYFSGGCRNGGPPFD